MARKSGLGVSTVLLTDDLILKYSEDRVITNKRNINLKVDKYYEPVPGGLYDSNYFGSIFVDSCNCKLVKKVNTYCYSCGSTPLDEETRNSRFARIELPWMYVPYFKLKGLKDFIDSNFKVKYDFSKTEITGRGKLIRGLELGQVEVSLQDGDDKPTIMLHDNYTDISKCSYEGLLSGLESIGMSSEAAELKRFIDKNILVLPASMRGIKFTTIAGKKHLVLPKTTAIYTSIIMAIEQISEGNKRTLPEEIVVRGLLRLYCRKSLMELSEFTKPSKENIARQMFSARVPNTSRSVITAGPELNIDQISLPFQNAYTILKVRFINHMMTEKGINWSKALRLYESGKQRILDEFEDWVKVEEPIVAMVRQPALHKYSMMSFKVKIHKGHDMKLALEVCGPFG